MAEIYDRNGECRAQGLQSSVACDEAIHLARELAADSKEEVFLEDDDSRTTVWPDGTIEDGWEGDWETE